MADVVEKGGLSLQSAGATGTAVTGVVSSVAALASSVAAVASGTGSLPPEETISTSASWESEETSTTPGDLSPSLLQVLETAFSGSEPAVTSSPSSTPHDEL